MRLPPILASLVLAASSASATVTLQFNSPSDGSLQNFANSAGVGGTAMGWGIIIDTAGNGFSYTAPNTYYASAGHTYTGQTVQALSLYGGGATDDVLFLSIGALNVQVSAVDGMPAGTNRATTIPGVPYGSSGISFEDPFVVVWFDSLTNGNSIPFGSKFGAMSNAGLTIPGDSATFSFAELFAGPDPLKTEAFHFDNIPEPSAALVGLLGTATLLRRRR